MKKLLSVGVFSLAMVACSQAPQSVADEPTSGPALPESEFAKYAGVYAGSYVCANGENGLTVSFDTFADLIGMEGEKTAKVEGRLWFYDVMSNTSHPSGAFKLSGTITGDTIDLDPAGWISEEPANWGAAGIEGSFVDLDVEMMLTGKPTGPGTGACQDFVLKRLEGL